MGKEKTTLTPEKNKLILALYDEYFHTLMGLALHLTKNETEAEELIACTFAKICQWHIDRLQRVTDWDTPSAYTYLSNTLANLHIDRHRKKSNQKRLEKSYDDRTNLRFENSPESIFLAKENVRIIKNAYYETLAQESKIVRVAFYLRTQRGMKNAEIAKRLNQSANTIGTNFRRLRIKIKEKIS